MFRRWPASRRQFGGRVGFAVLALGWATLTLPTWQRTRFGEVNEETSRVAPAPADAPDILLIIIDTLRADRVGPQPGKPSLTPAIDRFAARSAVFTAHGSSSAWTLPAIGTLLTGQSPTRHGARMMTHMLGAETDRGRFGTSLLRPELPTLATVAREAGYETALIGTNPYLSPQFGLSRGFGHYEVRLVSGARYLTMTAGLASLGWRPLEDPVPTRPADEMVDAFLTWLERPRLRPRLLVAHLMDPHFPYTPPPDLLPDALPVPLERVRPVSRLASLYEGEVRFVDRQVGRLLERLESSGALAHTVVAITADHGEQFLEHGSWVGWREFPDGFDPYYRRGIDHGHALYQELLHVPFLLYLPGVLGSVVETPSRAVDVMPTLLEAAGLPVPAGLEGQVLRPGFAPRPLLSEAMLSGTEKKAWREGPWKLIFKPAWPPDSQLELYNLEEDPLEKQNLVTREELVARRLERNLFRHLTALTQQNAGAEGALVTPDEDTLEKLRALGYLE